MQMLINEGWFSNMDEILSDALRRFLDSHKPDIMEHFIQEDVDWDDIDGDFSVEHYNPNEGWACFT